MENKFYFSKNLIKETSLAFTKVLVLGIGPVSISSLSFSLLMANDNPKNKITGRINKITGDADSIDFFMAVCFDDQIFSFCPA